MPEGGHLPPLNWPDLTRARDERPTKVTGSRLVVWPLVGGSLLLWECGPLACDPEQGQPCVRVWPEAEGRLFNFTVTASLEIVLQVVRLVLLGLVMVTISEPMSGWYHIGTSHAFSQIL